jgi:hypothetical protein
MHDEKERSLRALRDDDMEMDVGQWQSANSADLKDDRVELHSKATIRRHTQPSKQA